MPRRTWRPPKLLAFAYWRLRETFPYESATYASLRAGAYLGLAELAGIFGAIFGIFVLLNRRLPPPSTSIKLVIFSLSFLVVCANYYLLDYQNRWTYFKPEFETYSRSARITGSILTSAVPLLFAFAIIMAKAASELPR